MSYSDDLYVQAHLANLDRSVARFRLEREARRSSPRRNVVAEARRSLATIARSLRPSRGARIARA